MRFQRKRRALGSMPVVGSSCGVSSCLLLSPPGPTSQAHHGEGFDVPTPTPRAHQEDEGGVPNKSNSGRQLPLVAATVGASGLVCVLGQLQFLQCPLHHLLRMSVRMGGSGGMGAKLASSAEVSGGRIGQHRIIQCRKNGDMGWNSGPWGQVEDAPLAHPSLILPGDAAKPRVQLQVLPCGELVE